MYWSCEWREDLLKQAQDHLLCSAIRTSNRTTLGSIDRRPGAMLFSVGVRASPKFQSKLLYDLLLNLDL